MSRVVLRRRVGRGDCGCEILWLLPAPVEELRREMGEEIGAEIGGEIGARDLAVLSGQTRTHVRVQPGYALTQGAELGARGDRVARVRRIAALVLPGRLVIAAPEDAESPRRLLERAGDARDAFDLFYLLWDDLTERLLEASERTVTAAEEVSQRVLIGPKRGLSRATYRVRRAAFAVRLAVSRAHAAFAVLDSERPDWWPQSAKERCHELRERIGAVRDDVESVREALGETVEAFASVQSNDMNRVMQFLTLVSLLFLPPTLIASIYGMNFRIPEYGWPHGYAYSLVLMAALSGGLVLWAWKRRWLP